MKMTTTQPRQLIQPRYLDVEAAAVHLGMTPGALYKSAQRRQVPHRKTGKRLVFDRLALDGWIQGLEGVDVEEIARQQGNVAGIGQRRSGSSQGAGEGIR